MRKNTRKFKPNPSNNQRSHNNIRSFSIRDIIGDRRFNDQFSRVNNTHGNEGIKKVKRTKVGDTEADDFSNLGPNASSTQCEATGDPSRDYGDLAAKTSEYAFFKKMKQNTNIEVHVHRNNHCNELNNDQQSHHFTREEIPTVQKENIKQRHHFTREEIPNVQKENIKQVRFSSPIEREQNDAQYSLFSTPCVPKNSEENNIFGADITNVQNVKPGAYNWLTPSMDSKSKNLGDKGVFSMKREKLRNLVAKNNLLYDGDEVSSNGFDLVSALISRLLPPDQKNNSRKDPVLCQNQTDSKYEGNEDYNRKLIESHNTSYLDDGFSRSTKRLINTDLLEWDPTDHAPKSSIQYNRRHTEASKESLIKYPRISYMDDCFYSSTERRIDMYSPMCSEELFLGGHSPKCSIRYNHGRTEYGSRNPNFNIDNILSFDESRNLHELETSDFRNEPKLLEPPQTLLLGWEDNTENDKFQRSGFDSQTEINPFSPSSTSHLFMSSLPSSPCMNRHLKQEYLLASSIIPYTPKHLTTVEDCSTWCMNESLNENEHSGSKSGSRNPKCSIRYNHGRTEYGSRNPNFDIDNILSFDESRNLHELETSHFHNGPKLMEPPQTLLLGWEDNTENDKFELSAFDSQTEINPFSPSSTSHLFMSSLPLSPYIKRHLKQEHLLASSIIPYTPKHLTTVEDCNTWCMNESLNENEHGGSESSLFLIQSPTNNILRFLNSGLNSFAVNNENEENFVYRSDEFSEGRVTGYGSSSYTESFDDGHLDNIKYPLLLHDASWNE